MGVVKIGGDGRGSRRSHRRAHVGGVGDAQIDDGADAHLPDKGRRHRPADQRRARSGGRPLGGRGTLPAVFEREAELPLGGTEMGGGHRRGPLSQPALNEEGGHAEAFGHRRTGAVEPQKGDFQLPQAVGRADALV